MQRTVKILAVFALAAVVGFGPLYCHSAESRLHGDADAVKRIISAGKENNKAMEHLADLVNDIGSRPMGSVNFLKACEWARDEFRKFGLENVHLEQCGVTKCDFSEENASAFFKRFQESMSGGEVGGELVPIYNVIADIPGRELPDEYVIVGAHLDSAPQGPGATDNGAGVAAVMAASRMLAASGVKPRRTIRFILFGGEEAGLVGSRGYVEDHPEILPKVSAVYNMDHGANVISGVLATEPLAADMKEIFASAMTLDPGLPFEVKEVEYLPKADPNCCAAMLHKMSESEMTEVIASPAGCGAAGELGALDSIAGGEGIIVKKVTPGGDTLVMHMLMPGAPNGGKDLDLENLDLEALGISPDTLEGGRAIKKIVAIGSSDHAPFLAAGIPAFWWEQDEDPSVPYPVHTARDTYDKVNARYLEHSAAVIALGAFGTANLDHMLSREKLTAPDEKTAGSGGPADGSDRKLP